LASEIGALTEFRAFRNTDPPRLAEVWRSQEPSRGLMQPMSAALLEHYVLSKPTFDPAGLIVAVEHGQLVGFAHAGFGPNADQSGLSKEVGVTSLVMTRPDAAANVAAELLARAEQYLRDRGARTLYGGGSYPLSPFYLGLYGGSEASGILDSDAAWQRLFVEAGYCPAKRSLVLERDLVGFRPVVDRTQIQIRRTTRLETTVDPPARTWWEGVMFEPFERTRWALIEREGEPSLASLYLWNLETMLGAWGVRAVGVVDVEVTSDRRRRGLATNLLGEALRHALSQGITLAEAHVPEQNTAGRAVFERLGFNQVDASTVYSKE
jgi:GNAT superfamily N-acetyltransferase